MRGRLAIIPGILSPAFFLVARDQGRESKKRGRPEKLKYACAEAEQVKGKNENDIIQMTTIWPSTISDKMIFCAKNGLFQQN